MTAARTDVNISVSAGHPRTGSGHCPDTFADTQIIDFVSKTRVAMSGHLTGHHLGLFQHIVAKGFIMKSGIREGGTCPDIAATLLVGCPKTS